ncbi:hypothetical protein RFI_23980 [Reticulomyxa filosa]|uniref:Tr-type G domain-containing protein n=1 Tax=Reticulomyxa filosa TaxID=46433 RepID=X6MIE5_RETFI|nr:hypothetical protein RFI_23980 [Reticulomyxa filosa]|eukprot:ETO13396.1 hypothetical protein RFI_23980 [Reticulomyxa filosa]
MTKQKRAVFGKKLKLATDEIDLHPDDLISEEWEEDYACQECKQKREGYADSSGVFYCYDCWDTYNMVESQSTKDITKPAPGDKYRRRQKRTKKQKKKKKKNAAKLEEAADKTQTDSMTTETKTTVVESATAASSAMHATTYESIPTKIDKSSRPDFLKDRPSFLSFEGSSQQKVQQTDVDAKGGDKSKKKVTPQVTTTTTIKTKPTYGKPDNKKQPSNAKQEGQKKKQQQKEEKEEKKEDDRSNGNIPPLVRFQGMRVESAKEFQKTKEKKLQLLLNKLKDEETIITQQTNVKSEHKPHINLVIVGHVDHGKSTLMGHLLYNLQKVDKREMHKIQKESNEIGIFFVLFFFTYTFFCCCFFFYPYFEQLMSKGTFAYAWVLDCHEEERVRGITVDVSVNYFETKCRRITLLDSPGHKDFIPNMISGAAQADCAILVVSAIPNEFNSGFNKQGQTREHAVLIRSLGVSQVIVAINKMDMVQWQQEKFQNVQAELASFLQEIGFPAQKLAFVPVSGLEGENLSTPSNLKTLRQWYTGPCLVDLIDVLEPPSQLKEQCLNKPLRVTITDTYRDAAMGGAVLSGKVLSGSLINGEQIVIQPSSLVTKVKKVANVENKQLDIAIVGDNVQLFVNIKDEEEFVQIHVGDVICSPQIDNASRERPLVPCKAFECKLVTMRNMVMPLCRGQEMIAHVQSISASVIVKKLHYLIDVKTGQVLREPGKKVLRHVKANQTAVVTFQVKPGYFFCVDTFEQVKALGRVTFRRDGEVIAIAQITNLSW